MRVLHCLNILAPGGVERRKASIFARLTEGYEHAVICVEVADVSFAKSLGERLTFILTTGEVRSPLHPKRYFQAIRTIRKFRPDIIHGAVIEGYTLAGVAGRLAGVPIIIAEETSYPMNRTWRGNALARLSFALATHCIAVSPAVGRYLTDTLGVPSHKVSVIFNGVEEPVVPDRKMTTALRSSFGIPESGIVVGAVGRLSPEKRFCDLIKSMDLLDRNDVWLMIVGDGPERRNLQALAARQASSDRIVFTGFANDVGPYYGAMDLFALASEREAFGLVLAEAMLARLPVVATRVGGIPDVVVDGLTGLLVPPRDVPALSAALRKAIDDGRPMGVAGRRRAQDLFTADAHVARVEQLYKALSAMHRHRYPGLRPAPASIDHTSVVPSSGTIMNAVVRLKAQLLHMVPLLRAFSVTRKGLTQVGWYRSTVEGLPVDRDGAPLPWLTYPALHLLRARTPQTARIFEYGAGNSTLWWSARAREVVACEHDADWAARTSSLAASNVLVVYQPHRAQYPTEILKHGSFDIVVIDGVDRTYCAPFAAQSLNDGGVILWDNSDREEYETALSELRATGFKQLDLFGLAPGSDHYGCTSIFYRSGNCLGL